MLYMGTTLRLDKRSRTNDTLVDALLRDIFPVNEFDGAVGALFSAATARDTFRGNARFAVDAWHIPRARLGAHTTTDAALGIDRAGTRLFVGVNGVNRAVLQALRIGALFTMLNGKLACAGAVTQRAVARVGTCTP